MSRRRPPKALLSGRTAPVWLLVLAIAASTVSSGAVPILYDWMATAPVVVIGTIVVDDQRYIEIEPSLVLRGASAPGARLAVDVRSANRDRKAGTPAVKPLYGQSFLMLLAPAANDARGDKKSKRRVHQLVHGPAGARELPPEGRDAFVDAVRKMAAVQALKNDSLAWLEFRRMLEETNPLLVETALHMYEKFRRAGTDELPVVRPLLDHPRPELRAAAARVLGTVAAGRQRIPTEQAVAIVGELTARARRDEEIPVRVAATAALAAFPGELTDELLQSIATQDPEQAVRFEAHKALFERGAVPPPLSRKN